MIINQNYPANMYKTNLTFQETGQDNSDNQIFEKYNMAKTQYFNNQNLDKNIKEEDKKFTRLNIKNFFIESPLITGLTALLLAETFFALSPAIIKVCKEVIKEKKINKNILKNSFKNVWKTHFKDDYFYADLILGSIPFSLMSAFIASDAKKNNKQWENLFRINSSENNSSKK